MMEVIFIDFTTAEATQNPFVGFTELEKMNSLNFNDRISKIEADNQSQKIEITLLNSLSQEDRKVIKQLNVRVAQLEKLVVNNETDEKILGREKRPFRLLPLNAFDG